MKTVTVEKFGYGIHSLIEVAHNGEQWFKRYQSKGPYGYQWGKWAPCGTAKPHDVLHRCLTKARLPAPGQ